MITELYGLPGAGKTTIIKNITGGSATTISGITGFRRHIIQFVKRLVVYLPSSMCYKRQIKYVMRPYRKKSIYISRHQRWHYNNIVMIAFGYRTIRKVVYMDEGLIHRIITMAVNFGLSDEDVFTLIDLFEPCMRNVRSFYLNISAEDCMRSILARDRHECEMDEFDEDILLKYLKSYEHYCLTICEKYHHMVVTRENYEVMR